MHSILNRQPSILLLEIQRLAVMKLCAFLICDYFDDVKQDHIKLYMLERQCRLCPLQSILKLEQQFNFYVFSITV